MQYILKDGTNLGFYSHIMNTLLITDLAGDIAYKIDLHRHSYIYFQKERDEIRVFRRH